LVHSEGVNPEKIEQMVQESMMQSNVHFLGTRRDVSQVISAFDVAVMSSDFETFSNAILEYMAASKPVVATNVGSTAELVIDGETGYLIPCRDSEAMAKAIMRLLKDKELAKKMGEAGREKVREKFTIEKMIEKYESLFAGLVE
ncbi:MAG: glycosyltransferase, partial [Nitrospirae bacterium]|nr:glycosyltransferase [Nitrospirota bacterium]